MYVLLLLHIEQQFIFFNFPYPSLTDNVQTFIQNLLLKMMKWQPDLEHGCFLGVGLVDVTQVWTQPFHSLGYPPRGGMMPLRSV